MLIGLWPVLGGCGRSEPTPELDPVDTPDERQTTPDAPAAVAGQDRDSLLKKIRTNAPSVQRQAAEQLAKMAEKDPKVVPGLLEALSEKTNRGPGSVLPLDPSSVREAVVLALMAAGEQGEEALKNQGIAKLRDGLADSDPAVREHTALALARAGELAKPAADELWKVAADESPTARAAAFDALRKAKPDSMLPGAQLLGHESEEVRQQAAVALGGFGKLTPDCVPALTQALDDDDPLVRGAAANALGDLGEEAATAVPKLIGLLARTSTEDLQAAESVGLSPVLALAKIGEPAVKPAIVALSDKDPIVRFQAAYVLGEIGPPAKEAIPELQTKLRDPVGDVALESARALAIISGESDRAKEIIKLAVTDMNPQVRMAGVQTAYRMGESGSAVASLIFPLLEDMEPTIRRLAVRFIGNLPSEAAVAAVPQLTARLDEEETDERVRLMAVQILQDLGSEASEAAEALGDAARKDESDQVREAAIQALAALGPSGKPAMSRLTDLANNSDTPMTLRAQALTAAVRVGGSDVATAVLRAARSDDQQLRVAAVRTSAHFGSVPSTVVRRLAEMLDKDQSQLVRLAAVQSLARLGKSAEPVRESLQKASEGTAPDLALWAKLALARIDGKPEQLRGEVRQAIDASRQTVIMAGVMALPMVEPTAEDVVLLAPFLEDRSPLFRKAAVESAGECGPLAAPLAPAVAKLLSDNNGEVKLAAAEALGNLGDSTRIIRDALREAEQTDPMLSRAALASLKKLGEVPR